MASYPRILVVDQDPQSRAELQQLLLKSRFVVVGGVGYDEEAVGLAGELKPQIVLVALEDPPAHALRTIQALAQAVPSTPVIAYSSLSEVEPVRQAMLAGAWDYLVKPVGPQELMASMERALGGERVPALLAKHGTKTVQGSSVTAIFSAKGGVGKTTLAVNLAAALAQAGAAPVVVDLDSAFGDVARMMKIGVDRSFVEAALQAHALDEFSVGTYLLSHPCGVKVLSAPREPTDWREIDPAAVERLLTLLAKAYPFLIIDTPATFTDLVIPALHKADHLFLMSSLDPISIEGTAVALRILRSSPQADGRIKLILNQQTPSSHLREGDAVQELGQEPFWSLPYDEYAGYRDESGRPVVICQPDARISRSISDMVPQLTGLSLAPPQPVHGNGSGLFRRLFKT